MSTITLERSATAGTLPARLRFARKRLTVAGLAFAVALGAAGYGRYWWETGRFIETTDDAYAGGNVTAVAPHVAGFIGEILVTDNQHVGAGQVLVRLDDRDFRAGLDHAQATAEQRQATLAGLEAKYALQQAMIAKAEADLAAQSARAAFAGEDAVRYRNLAASTYASAAVARSAFCRDP